MSTETNDNHYLRIRAPAQHRGKRLLLWLAVSLFCLAAGLGVVAEMMLRRAGPILKARLTETLRTRFNSRVELDAFNVSVIHGIDASGAGLRIFAPDDVIAAGEREPIIAIRDFGFHTSLRGFFEKPTRVSTVHISGMTITVPPGTMRGHARPGSGAGKIKLVVDTLIFENSSLILQNSRPDKDPKIFELRHIEMRDYGAAFPLSYDAVLTNAIPRGNIHATGKFGPWNTESPGDTPISGRYVFDHAQLSSIRGIAGTLESAGDFYGRLHHIDIIGMTDTPDFSLDSAERPMPLHTAFHAVVDGLSGDTYLQPVRARLGTSEFSCAGTVINVRAKGHLIDLNVDIPDGRVEDFLRLAVRKQPFIIGRLQMRARLNIPPGRESVVKKIALESEFSMRGIHFTNPATEDKIDELALRAQGKPTEARPGAPDVRSTLAGMFHLRHGQLNFSRLEYGLPGGKIELSGTYNTAGEQINLVGEIRTEAKLSQMVTSRWKSWLLKPVDPFFRKDGSGAVIPIRITGTKDDPKFSLDLKHLGGKANAPPRID